MMENNITRTTGLEKSIELCVGAGVMLRRNKDVDAGLVNGSVDEVKDNRRHHSSTYNLSLLPYTEKHAVSKYRRAYYTRENNFHGWQHLA